MYSVVKLLSRIYLLLKSTWNLLSWVFHFLNILIYIYMPISIIIDLSYFRIHRTFWRHTWIIAIITQDRLPGFSPEFWHWALKRSYIVNYDPHAVCRFTCLVVKVIKPKRLQNLFPEIKNCYVQQPLDYGRYSRYGDDWRISCYLVVMENWKPKIMPHEPMLRSVVW